MSAALGDFSGHAGRGRRERHLDAEFATSVAVEAKSRIAALPTGICGGTHMGSCATRRAPC